MKVTNVRDFRNKATTYLKAEELVLVTRHGKAAGLLIPLDDPDNLPFELRRELLVHLGRYFNRLLEKKGISEEKIIDDFKAHRKSRR